VGGGHVSTVGKSTDTFGSDAPNKVVGVVHPEERTVSVALPEPHQRWRCGGCGNLTRFDVARSRRTTEFWHFDLAGDHAVEETELRGEVVESVTCRWCGRSDAIVP